MKILLFTEGHTEYKALPEFINRILQKQINKSVKIEAVNFESKDNLIKNAPKKVKWHLERDSQNEIIAIISIIDLYRAFDTPEYDALDSIEQKYDYVKNKIESSVSNPKFAHFSSVHEVEAWLLSSPEIFPAAIRDDILGKSQKPEDVNFDQPPAKFLDRLYKEKIYRMGRPAKYKKIGDGLELFSKLDPEIVYQKCPHFKEMIDHIVRIAA
jgi:hypothetical protein